MKIKNKAFSIVEVLVVVTIIGLLISMLLLLRVMAQRRAQAVEEHGVVPLGQIYLESNEDYVNAYIPITATNIRDHGNYTWEFTLANHQWMYISGNATCMNCCGEQLE